MAKIIAVGDTEQELRDSFNREIENLILDGTIEGRI